MQTIIFPLTITQVDWTTYIKVCQEILGLSPARNLDEAHMDLKDPSSFLASLVMSSNPKDNLRQVDKTFDHMSMSFITSGNVLTISSLMSTLDLKCHILGSTTINNIEQTLIYLIILTGTMKQWFDSILLGCSSSTSYDIRLRMNHCYIYFMRSGFKEVWAKFTKKELKDGTFTLS